MLYITILCSNFNDVFHLPGMLLLPVLKLNNEDLCLLVMGMSNSKVFFLITQPKHICGYSKEPSQ